MRQITISFKSFHRNLIILTILLPFFTQAQWIQLGSDIDGEAAGDQLSAVSVSLSSDGNILAIGAPRNDGNGTDAGHVRVYDWDGMNWIQKGTDIDGEAAGDRSGRSVSLSSDGNTLSIGAHFNDGNGTDAGHVRVYDWDGMNWIQKGIDIDGEATGDESGVSTNLSSNGNTIAIGAYLNDGNGTDAGHVRVYDWDGMNWIQKGNDIDAENGADYSSTVSLSSNGNTVVIGGPWNDGNGNRSGHVRVYFWDGMNWIQKGTDIDGEMAEDRSGGRLSLSSDGNILAISSSYNDDNGTDAGHVRVYDWDGMNWIQKGTDIDGEATGDFIGSVSLSSDGNILAIGATRNDGNGTDAGHVRVYTWNETAWTQIGSDIDGEATGDQSGWDVSLSSDGNILAIAANLNDGNGTDAGHVRVYKYFIPQTITFDALDIQALGDGNITLAATSSSGLPITYGSSNTSVATISGNVLTIVGAGTTDITASQLGNNTYNSAIDVIQTFKVKDNQVITFDPSENINLSNGSLVLSATASSGLPVSYVSSDLSIAEVSGNTLILRDLGSVTLTASQAGNADFTPAENVSRTLTITLDPPSNILGISEEDTVGCEWEDNTDSEIAYEVWYALSSDENESFKRVAVLPTNSTAFRMPAQSSSRTHIFKVRALGPDSIPSLWADNFAVVITDYILGLEEISESGVISIYPNPVKDILQIEVSALDPIQIQVFDSQGKLIDEKVIKSWIEWDMKSYSVGQYNFLFQIGQTWYQEKILKE